MNTGDESRSGPLGAFFWMDFSSFVRYLADSINRWADRAYDARAPRLTILAADAVGQVNEAPVGAGRQPAFALGIMGLATSSGTASPGVVVSQQHPASPARV